MPPHPLGINPGTVNCVQINSGAAGSSVLDGFNIIGDLQPAAGSSSYALYIHNCGSALKVATIEYWADMGAMAQLEPTGSLGRSGPLGQRALTPWIYSSPMDAAAILAICQHLRGRPRRDQQLRGSEYQRGEWGQPGLSHLFRRRDRLARSEWFYRLQLGRRWRYLWAGLLPEYLLRGNDIWTSHSFFRWARSGRFFRHSWCRLQRPGGNGDQRFVDTLHSHRRSFRYPRRRGWGRRLWSRSVCGNCVFWNL